MGASIDDCRWPELSEPYAGALRECVGFLLRRFDVLAVFASGTIVRGCPDPSSDLDLYVVHEGTFMQRLQRFFQGIPAEMFVNPESMVYRHMDRELKECRPIAAHMVQNGFVVVDLSGVAERLRSAAREHLSVSPVRTAGQLTSSRYMAASLFEDAIDRQGPDPETCDMILHEAFAAMLAHRFAAAGRFFPRRKDLLVRLAEFDAQAAGVARAFYSAASLEERIRLATEMADRAIGARGFFEWDGEPIAVEPDGPPL